MTRETKFGLLLVLTLTATFGFLVWKKMHQPKDLVATTESTENKEDGNTEGNPSEDPLGLVNSSNTAAPGLPLAAMTPEKTTPRRPATPDENASRNDPLFAENTPVTKPASATRPKPKLPANLDERDFFAAPKNAARETPKAPPIDPDPFDAQADRNAPTKTVVERDPFGNPTEPTTSSPTASQEPDPFVESTPVNTVPAQPVKVGKTAAFSNENEQDPFANAPVETPSRQPVLNTPPAQDVDPLADTAPVERRETIAMPARSRSFEERVESAPEVDPFAATPAEAPVEVSARSSVPAEPVIIEEEKPITVPDPVLNLPGGAQPEIPRNTATAAATEPDPFFVEENVPARTPIAPRTTPVPRAAVPVIEPDPFGAPAAIPETSVRAESVPLRAEPVPLRAEPVPFRAEHVPHRAPSRGAAPMAFAGETYIVQPNDNFWTISKKVYGSGRYFEALAHYNAALVSDPSKMKPGLKIATPTEAELQHRYAKLLAANGTQITTPAQDPVSLGIPGDIYTAVSGDNFWEISKRLYGDGKYFRALEQHNAAIVSDPQKLKPGMKLAVPKAAWLQAKYPQLITHAAPAVHDLKMTRPDRYQPDEPAGFFIGPGEQPMYRVGTRDTLSDIAQNYLGRSSRWVQILEMNRDVITDGNALAVGTVLRLPADASRVAVIEPGVHRR